MSNSITDSQDEYSLDGLFRDSDQVHIPVFQREYVWKSTQLNDLLEDMRLIRDSEESIQFLGAIVSCARPRPREVIGRLKAIDVVDGQQRILTLYLFVMAITELMLKYDVPLAVQNAKDYLLLPYRRGLQVNTRIVPSYPDRSQFALLWDRLRAVSPFIHKLGDDRPSLPPQSGAPSGGLIAQYKRIMRFLKGQIRNKNSDDSLNELTEIQGIITHKFTFVILELNDAATATKIFERLNNRGQRVGIVDLVRNEVFSREADDLERAITCYHDSWIPFIGRFNGHEEQFFFPYCLIHNSNTKKSELFQELRLIWHDKTPADIINHMEPYRTPFLAVDQGHEFGCPDIHLRLKRLNRIGRPSSVYSFLMILLYSYRQDEVETEVVVQILDLIESFLVRRAILGYEPTGLHSVFKGMWQEVQRDLSMTAVSDAIRKRTTIQWPTDTDLKDAICVRELAKARICSYLLVEYDRNLAGDNPESDPTIEHVMPKSRQIGSYWAQVFSASEHRKLLDTWANLVPLSGQLNESLQRAEYEVKSRRYREESMFSTPRAVGEQWSEWTPDVLRERANILGSWAVDRWPHGPSDQG